MTTHVRNPNVYLTDRNIYEGLQQIRKASASTIAALALRRGLILSTDDPKEDLAMYLSRLTHSWHDIQGIVSLVNTTDRAERSKSRALPFKKSVKETQAAVEQLEAHAGRHGEVWKRSLVNGGKTVRVEIKYQVPDFGKSTITQLTQKVCKIDLTPESGQIKIRHDLQNRGDQFAQALLRIFNEQGDQKRDLVEIELSGVSKNSLRSEFFIRLIQEVAPESRLVEVASVRGNNPSTSATPTRSERRAASALRNAVSAVRRMSLHGTSILDTSEYKGFFGARRGGGEPAFHLSAITWTSDISIVGCDLQAQFEVGFTDQLNCAGFVFRVRKVWYREKGELRRTGCSPQPQDEQRLGGLIESKARALCEEIKSKK